MSLTDAISLAKKENLDLVEITATATPPVVKIADYGKFEYELNKKKREYTKQDREKGKLLDEKVKKIQIKPVTGEDTLKQRAKTISKWLENGSKVNLNLFLSGRYRQMDEQFLRDKLEKFLKLIEVDIDHKEEIKKSPKGFSILLQKPKK